MDRILRGEKPAVTQAELGKFHRPGIEISGMSSPEGATRFAYCALRAGKT